MLVDYKSDMETFITFLYSRHSSRKLFFQFPQTNFLSTISRPLASNQIELKLNWMIFSVFLYAFQFTFSPLKHLAPVPSSSSSSFRDMQCGTSYIHF